MAGNEKKPEIDGVNLSLVKDVRATDYGPHIVLCVVISSPQ